MECFCVLHWIGKYFRQDLDGHLDEVEVGLNSLRDLFKGDDYQVDGDTLIGVSNSNRPYFNLAAIDPETYVQVNEEQSTMKPLMESLKIPVVLLFPLSSANIRNV